MGYRENGNQRGTVSRMRRGFEQLPGLTALFIMLGALAPPASLNGCDVLINASIGITTFPGASDEVEALLKEADAAMYRA